MNIRALLGETSLQEFLERNYLKLPFSKAGAASDLCHLGAWETLGEILASPDPDVMVVRAGRRVDAAPPRSSAEAQALSSEGCTILVRNAQRHHEELRTIAQSFEDVFRGVVNIHVYATPAGQHGFNWHYDAEEVFIVQTAGRKEYSLRKNTVHPWPLEETLPQDMAFEREIMPLMRCLLDAGDWLYIPSGYWHRAEALESDQAAVSLAIGVTAPSAVDVLDLLRKQAPQSILWRQRLPLTGQASAEDLKLWDEHIDAVCSQLADDLKKMLHSDGLRESLREMLSTHIQPNDEDREDEAARSRP